MQWGTYAEYVVLEEAIVAKIPRTLTMEQAAGIPLAGLTAWQALHQFNFSLRNKRVLIHGAAGGVGSFALQFAKALGAEVIATARASNLGYLKDLGADHLIDYEVQDVGVEVKTIFPEGIDFVLDTVGGQTLISSFLLLKKGGGIVSIIERPKEDLAKQLEVQIAYVFVTPNANDLRIISELFECKKVKMPEYQIFPLSQAKQAQELSQSGHVRGKITLDISK